MAQIESVFINMRCPHCGNRVYDSAEIAIAGTGADDGGIGDKEGVSRIECDECNETFEVVLQCFAKVGP